MQIISASITNDTIEIIIKEILYFIFLFFKISFIVIIIYTLDTRKPDTKFIIREKITDIILNFKP